MIVVLIVSFALVGKWCHHFPPAGREKETYAIGPLREITDILSGEQRITSSAIKPLLDVIYKKMVAVADDDSSLTQKMKGRIECDLRSRYVTPEVNHLLDKCSFLDPRFKQNYSIDDECVKEVMSEMVPSLSEQSAPPAPGSEPSGPPCSKKGKFSKLFGTSFPNTASQPLSDEDRES